MARRLSLYFFGFLIGIIFVLFYYSDKSESITGWMPEKRVLKRLRMTEKIISDSMQCVLDCQGLDSTDWKNLLKDGEVSFDEARHKPYPIYSVNLKKEDYRFTYRFETVDTLSYLIGIDRQPPMHCDCP